MFPISFMYYFGTNLETRFAVPDLFPKREGTYRIPFEREEIQQELENQRNKRLLRRKGRLENEAILDSLRESSSNLAKDLLSRRSSFPWWYPGDLRRRLEAEQDKASDDQIVRQ